jgi:hypothetical protein
LFHLAQSCLSNSVPLFLCGMDVAEPIFK